MPSMLEADPVLDLLLRMAADYSPEANEREEQRMRMMGTYQLAPPTYTLLDHPLRTELVAALQIDADFAQFTREGGVFISVSTGSGSTREGWSFAHDMVASAAVMLIARGRPVTSTDLVEELRSVVPAFRRLLRGEEGHAVYLTGLDGFELPPDATVATPWGLLRPAGERERTHGIFHGRTSVVLVTDAPVRLTLNDPDSFAPDDGVARHVFEGMRRISLAALLSLKRDSHVAPRFSWMTAVAAGCPPVGSSSSSAAPQNPDPGDPLSESEIEALEAGITTVDRLWDASIWVAVQRTARAIRERRDPADALIDAVIAWENLVGGRGEQRFRVPAALTHLLEPDPRKRDDLRKRLRHVYDTRSKLVHGGAHDHPRAEANLAIEASVAALRALFSDLPSLISDRDRGDRLLLGDYVRGEAASASDNEP